MHTQQMQKSIKDWFENQPARISIKDLAIELGVHQKELRAAAKNMTEIKSTEFNSMTFYRPVEPLAISVKNNKIELLEEDIECFHMYLDAHNIPRTLGNNQYSMIGRMNIYVAALEAQIKGFSIGEYTQEEMNNREKVGKPAQDSGGWFDWHIGCRHLAKYTKIDIKVISGEIFSNVDSQDWMHYKFIIAYRIAKG